MIVVIVGGIGTGKSAVIKVLENLGEKVLSADAINKELLLNIEYVNIIDANFKGVVVDGKIDKKALRNIIFNNENERKKLNALAHPRIFSEIERRAKEYACVFVEIPLFEECYENVKYDKICAVQAPINARAERVAKRDGISLESALKIIEVQAKEESVYDRADFIINNDGDFLNLEKQVLRMLENVK